MEKSTLEILQEVLEEAEKGCVKLKTTDIDSSWKFYVKFLTNHRNQEEVPGLLPVLKVSSIEDLARKFDTYLPDAKHFNRLEQEYWGLNDENFIKKLIFDIFVSATPADFENIYAYIDLRHQMISNKCSKKLRYLGEYMGLDVYGEINKAASNLEAPYRMKLTLSNENESYELPRITFGFDDKKNVHVFAIQNKPVKEKTALYKKLDRHFRAVNKNVNPEDDIAQVSPSSLVAFTIFATYMEHHGIKNFKIHSYMPLRYQSHLNQVLNKTGNEEDAENEANRIEFNAVNKLVNVMLRFEHHFPNCKSYFDDYSNVFSLTVDTCMSEKDKQHYPELDGNIIQDISKIVENADNELSQSGKF